MLFPACTGIFRSLQCRLSDGTVNKCGDGKFRSNARFGESVADAAHTPANRGFRTLHWIGTTAFQERDCNTIVDPCGDTGVETCHGPNIGLPCLRQSVFSAAPALRMAGPRRRAASGATGGASMTTAAPFPRRTAPAPPARASRQHPAAHSRAPRILSTSPAPPPNSGTDRTQRAAMRHGGDRRRDGPRHLEQPDRGHLIVAEPAGHDRFGNLHRLSHLRLLNS